MSAQKTMSGRAWAELLLLSAIWGGSFLSVEFALRELPVFTIVAIRVSVASAILWGVILLRGVALPKGWRFWGAFLGMGILNNVLPFTLLIWAQVHIESGLTSILNATTAIFGVLLAALFFADEKLSVNKLVGVLLGFAGVLLTIGPEALEGLDLRSLAQLAAIGATLAYAFGGIWGRRFLSGLPSELAAAGMLTTASMIMLPVALTVDGVPDLTLRPETWAALGFYALVATAFAYLLYYRVLKLAGSGNLMLVTLFVPVVAILLGVFVLNERLAPGALAGFGLIAFGMIVLDGRVLRRLKTGLSV